VTVHYFSRIVQPEAVFFPYWTSNTVFFFRIVHYVREVTRWFLSSASKLFLIVINNQINLFESDYFFSLKSDKIIYLCENLNQKYLIKKMFCTNTISLRFFYWMLELFRQCAIFDFHFIIGYEKNPAELQLLKKISLWSSSVIKIVKMKYNRIKWWLVSTSLIRYP
jgi:hypothetical protein